GVIGHFPLAEIEYLLGCRRLLWLENHNQLDLVFGEFRWNGVGGGLQHRWVLVDHGLNLPRGNILTPAPHRRLLPTGVEEIALFIHPGQVTRVEPVVAPCLIGGILLTIIEGRAFASIRAKYQLTDFSWWEITVIVVNDSKFKPWQGPAHGTHL